MHNLDLILTLAVGLIGALAFGFLTQRLGWSPIVGYLLAGVAVGPYTPGFVADKALADQLAEVGVILLMFGVGLHFHLSDLLAVRKIAITGAVCQSTVATVTGALAARWAGWDWTAGLVFGLALSVASTVVLTRVLSDNGQLRSPTGRIAIGWLVVEDIFTVFVLVLLPAAFGGTAEAASSVPASLGIAALKVGAFIAFTLWAGARAIPWLLNHVAATHSRELFTLSVLAIALGIAVGAAFLFDVSMALGAFLAGMVVGQSDFSARAGAEALPLRDAFAVMFFLSVGMLLDLQQVFAAPLLLLATLAVVMIGKPLSAMLIVALLGYSSRVGLGVAIALAQIGEFSFLVASLARSLGVLPDEAMNPVVAAAILSIMLNPILYRLVNPLEEFLRRHPRLWSLLNRRSAPAADSDGGDERASSGRAVVVGFGPIGRALVRQLLGRGIEPTVIEMNIGTFHDIRSQHLRAVYGDAGQREVLEQAGVGKAGVFIVSMSGAASFTEAIRLARAINPKIHIIFRADYVGQAEYLRQAGADEVFSGEGEVALAMTDSVLRHFGATPEQLDEERARIRAELLELARGQSPSNKS